MAGRERERFTAPTFVVLQPALRGIRCLCQRHHSVEERVRLPEEEPVSSEGGDRRNGSPVRVQGRADDRAAGHILADEVARLRQSAASDGRDGQATDLHMPRLRTHRQEV
jgi:hypothetical protein